MTMTIPGACEAITRLRQSDPGLVVGAGTVLDIETASLSIEAGVLFLTSPTPDLEIVDFGAIP